MLSVEQFLAANGQIALLPTSAPGASLAVVATCDDYIMLSEKVLFSVVVR